jgi:hypothetical protein
MDLSTLEPTTDSVPVPLRHPVTNEKLLAAGGAPITVNIVGMDSEQFRTRHRAIINRRLSAGKKAKVTAEEIEAESIDTIAACITGWQQIELDGKPLEYSKGAAKTLLTRLPWLREQLDEAIADRANFLKTSQTN